MNKIYPVLLAGGLGTRLWPLSRQSFPKQFVSLMHAETAFQQTANRLSRDSDQIQMAGPIVVTGERYRFNCASQLADVGIEPAAIMLEPEGRGTAPPILAAALHVMARDPEAMLIVAPTDHDIQDADAFVAAVAKAAAAAQQGQLVCFGIEPRHPETGYGYIKVASEAGQDAVPVERFVEKPDLANAERMLAEGGHYWNAGIFMFTAASVVAAFQAHAPTMVPQVQAALDAERPDGVFVRLDADSWNAIVPDSVDYAIMEKADNVSVVPYAGHWSDLGDWRAVHAEGAQDQNGNGGAGPVVGIDNENSLLRSEDPDIHLVGIGLKNIVAVATKDAVLVADMAHTQQVSQAVKTLTAAGVTQATENLTDYRPWGSFHILADQPSFKVKRIIVTPGQQLSLQSHKYRSEHWVVVRGTATVTKDEEVITLQANESTYIPQGTIHRLANLTDAEVEIVEIQTGSYFGEDDILRYEDVYKR